MIRRLATLASLSAIAACSMAPKDVRPDLPVPPSWPIGDAYLRQSEAALPSVSYTDVFKDTRLQQLIKQALANNRDLRVAAANIEQARANYQIQRAAQLPEVDASGRAGYSHGGNGTSTTATSSSSSGTGSTGTGSTGTTTGATTTSATSSSRGGSFSANVGITSFELDLFGRLRSLSRAAQNRYFEQEAAARATRLTLVGDLATDWFTYASDRTLLTIAQQTAQSAAESVRITQLRLNGGIAPRSDLRQAQTILSTAQADVARQSTLVAQDANALQLLVGAPVDPALLPGSIETLGASVDELPAGLDSRVLLRRPDVVQAEYELRAINGEIGAARASLFPRITLTGLLGFASTALRTLFADGAFNYSGTANASYPIFRAGAARANVRLTEAERDAAVATYEKAIQTAFREVSDALARRGTIEAQVKAGNDLLAESRDTLQLEVLRYKGGIDPYLNTLDAQRTFYSAQQTVVSNQLTRLTNLVTLYRVLGGDALLEAAASGPVPQSPEPAMPGPRG